MTTSTISTIVSGAVTSLGDYFSVILPLLIPVTIAVAVLFAGWHLIRGLARRR